MSSRSLIHQLLFEALVELRHRGHESGDNVVFHLSDLFHNAVLQLRDVESSGQGEDDSYDEILAFIEMRAKEKGCDSWLKQKLDNIESKAEAG
jgi:hypothetical protein